MLMMHQGMLKGCSREADAQLPTCPVANMPWSTKPCHASENGREHARACLGAYCRNPTTREHERTRKQTSLEHLGHALEGEDNGALELRLGHVGKRGDHGLGLLFVQVCSPAPHARQRAPHPVCVCVRACVHSVCAHTQTRSRERWCVGGEMVCWARGRCTCAGELDACTCIFVFWF